MNWTEICIHTTNEAIESISYVVQEAGASGLVIEDPLDLVKAREAQFGEIYELDPKDFPDEGVRIKTYLPANSHLKDAIDKIRQEINALAAFHDLGKNEITFSEVHEEDWATAWKKYYKPVQVTDNITIKPIWEDYHRAKENEMIIEMDPGMAFGTGTHPTTILSIQALEKYLKQNESVIDVGSGSGILTIAAAKLGAAKIHAFDLDEVAVKSSKANIQLNDLASEITVNQNDLLKGINLEADLIVSNILAEIIVKFVSDAWSNLKNGGYFITSGIINDKKDMVLEELRNAGFEIVEQNELEDWISIIARKRQ
ncbi:50S ribosomal protein L11 methyltransferase [Oceanobacillus alkalisoli]|uniref:50S ribosomal protein L11 methyltransferase n=1 Tax=Oceanobacillus alkalisoli TaxID=2925113 RepID=UPI001EF0C0DA|nr:50S ribosomal protein L11 methyltransferase [Oceanobacillus alkalisoli]MCF3941812.1 50S ribosomal protein L11 methyltransferase [Oceanobacillus alkalisoli]MCG5103092.1 50S ribosomal protein L11 methyltransferase [Oceanobacillus alkalisoli]